MGLLSLFTKNKRGNTEGEFTPEALVGRKCQVTDRIDTFAGCGQVKVGSQSWSARGTRDDDRFEVGEILDIVAIEGVKLICVKHQ